MDLVLFGLNHTTAPLEIREKLAFRAEESSDVLSQLRTSGIFMESLLLSTCNRTEVYGTADVADDSVSDLRELLTSMRQCNIESIEDYSYVHLNTQAVQHLFRVSAGLDSMVLGEVEILHQIKDAYRAATGVDATGPYLNKLFHHCFRVGKRVRNETGISTGGLSVGSSAVELAAQVLGDLSRKRALLIGAGDTGQLVARHLRHAGIGELVVTNRTHSKAEEIAGTLSGSAIPFDSYEKNLYSYDLIISAVGSPEFTVRRRMVRRKRGMFPLFIDLGVPRDIDPDIEHKTGAIVYHVDDLQAIVNRQLGKREREKSAVEKIVSEETARFMGWSDSLRAADTISALHSKLGEIRSDTVKKWEGRLSDRELEFVDRISSELVNRILHEPTVNLKGCELGSGRKNCQDCEFFIRGQGCVHGHINQELKCIITRDLFGLNTETDQQQSGAGKQEEDVD